MRGFESLHWSVLLSVIGCYSVVHFELKHFLRSILTMCTNFYMAYRHDRVKKNWKYGLRETEKRKKTQTRETALCWVCVCYKGWRVSTALCFSLGETWVASAQSTVVYSGCTAQSLCLHCPPLCLNKWNNKPTSFKETIQQCKSTLEV